MSNSGVFIYLVNGIFNNTIPIVNEDDSFFVLNYSCDEFNIVRVNYSYINIINDDGLFLFNFNSYGIDKIISFGNIPISRQGNQFRNYKGTFPDDPFDTPTIVNNTSGSYIFSQTNFSSGVGNWNVENITNLLRAFERNKNFNENLNGWNLINLSGSIANIFEGCTSFNSDINEWNVKNVTNIQFSFANSAFNKPLFKWDVSNITDMVSAFSGCKTFNQNINNWNVSNLKNAGNMFSGCYYFNQPLDNWNTSNLNSINSMFSSCYFFNQNLNSWNVSNVTNFNGLFNTCYSFNQPLNNWNTSKVTNMANLFSSCKVFNQDISSWDVSSVTTMNNMFLFCLAFNQNLGSWNVSNVTSMTAMLNNTGLSVENYDNLLLGWSSRILKLNIDFGVFGLQYSSYGETGRNILKDVYKWSINGDALLCFIKNTMITILKDNVEIEMEIQNLKKNDLVKISTGEYKKIFYIGQQKIDITKNLKNIRIIKKNTINNNLPYKDLLLTSGHSVLFKNLKYINKNYINTIYDNNINGYYKITASDCSLFDVVKLKDIKNIIENDSVVCYHIALENDDLEGQYGIYSNGMLSETMSINIINKSGLIELL
jgi:surface protein